MNIKKQVLICTLVLLIVSMYSILAHAEISDTSAVIISLVNQDPDPASAGDIVEVRLGVENMGGAAAENLIIEVVPSYPFTMVTGESNIYKVGTLKEYQTGANMKIVKFKVRIDRDATAGQYSLKVKNYEEGKSDVGGIQDINIDIRSKESAEVIYIDKTVLVPGKEDTLQFTINNVGNSPLRDLTFSWINEDEIILPIGSDNTKYIKYIDVGGSSKLQYNVIADTNAEAGLYKLDLKLTYDDPLSETEKEINTLAGLYVGGGTDFDIAFSESSAGQTSFTIANVGSNPAFSVSVIVPQQQGWRVSGSNSMIIGNLNTGDYTVASFSLQSTQMRQDTTEQEKDTSQQELLVQRGDVQQNILKIQIAYTDTMGKRELVEKEVSLNPQALITSLTTDSETTNSQTAIASFRGRRQQGFFSKYKWYITVLVILAVVALAYWKYRKEKKIDPHFRIRDLFKIKTIKTLFKRNKKR